MRGGEGGPFYSPNRSVPGRDKGGDVDNRLLGDKNKLPAKTEPEPPQWGFGRPMGLANPLLRRFGPIFGRCTPCRPLYYVCRCQGLVDRFALSNRPIL